MKLKITGILFLMFSVLSFDISAQKKKTVKSSGEKTVKTTAAKNKKKIPEKQKKVIVKDSSSIKGATIEITQSYKPEIKQLSKPESIPALPPVDTGTVRLSLDVPPQWLSYNYGAMPLRPLVLGKDTAVSPYRNYVKIGGGNLATIFFDGGFAILKAKKISSAIHLHHISQSGPIANQKTSLTGLEADATVRTKANDWHLGLAVKHDRYNYYGDDPNTRPIYFSTSSVPQYTGLGINVDMESDVSKTLSYKPEISASYFANNDANEQKVNLAIPFTYTLNTEIKLRMGIAGMYAGLNRNTIPANINNNMVQFMPGIDYSIKNLSIQAGLYLTIGQSNSFLLPDIKATYNINNTQVNIFAGWKGTLIQNTYEQLTGRNPYLYNVYSSQQTHLNDIFGGLQTNISNHISFSGKASWKQYENMPLFVNDFAVANRLFLISYDKVNALSIEGSARYHIADIFAVGINAVYTTYNTTINKRAWHEPGIVFGADFMVRPMPKLLVTAYFSAMDEMYAIDAGNKTVKLKAAFDLGAYAEYSFVPRLSGFVKTNNIFNNQYERWYGYRVYGFNILGGVRLKF